MDNDTAKNFLDEIKYLKVEISNWRFVYFAIGFIFLNIVIFFKIYYGSNEPFGSYSEYKSLDQESLHNRFNVSL